MKKLHIIILLIFLLAEGHFLSFSQHTKIKWMTLQQLEIIQKKKPKKVFIEIYSKDCEWCKKFENEVLSNQFIASYLNKYYYVIKIEAFDKTSIRFNDKELISTNGFHPITSEYLKNQTPLSFPTVLFFDENLKMLNFLKGFNTATNFEMAINYFGQDYYKTLKWENFQSSFKGKIK